MSQDSLFDPPDPYQLARKTDPHTSLDAAKSLIAVRITETRKAILLVLKRSPDGLTDEEIARNLGPIASPSGLRTRRKELVEAGLVFDTGRRRTTRSRRRTIVWEATR
jgi:predicted transcriptional regulator